MIKQPLIVFILIDGARPDAIQKLLDTGDLPNIAGIIAGGTFRTAVTCCPSTTGPAYLPFLTGRFPGTANIPGIRWLDKRQFYGKKLSLSRFRSYNGIEAPLFNRDLPPHQPTIFELFSRPYNIYSIISRGLPKGHDLTARSKAIQYLYGHLTDDWTRVDNHGLTLLLRILDQDPDFIFAVFPGVDSYSHLSHPFHEKTMQAYRFIDMVVEKVSAKLRQQGRWDDTLLILTSDHGLTETHTHLDLALYLKRFGIDTLYYPIVWKRKPLASVMISGNALGHVYWLDGYHYNRLGRLQEMMPHIKEDLLGRNEIDMVVSRLAKREYLIESSRGGAIVGDTPAGLTYEPLDGDPLGYGGNLGPLNRRAALESTFDSDYPDGLLQIAQIFSCSRCSDWIVISNNGYDLRKAWEWPEHHASHGSLCRQHMIVPVIYNRTGWRQGPMRTTDLFNTMLKWAGKPIVDGTDGETLI